MKLIKILQRETGYFFFVFSVLGVVSGGLNALLIPLITHVISEYELHKRRDFLDEELLWFALLIITSMIISRIFSRFLINLTQKMVYRMRLEILNKVRLANFHAFENIGKEKIYTAITRDAGAVSGTASSLVFICTSMVTILGLLAYLCYLSWISFLATFAAMVIGSVVYWVRQQAIFEDLDEARKLENSFFKYVRELLLGFKEAKVNHNKNEDLWENYICGVSEESRMLSTKSSIKYLDNSLISRFTFMSLIAFVLFGMPFMTGQFEGMYEYVSIVLYVIGPIAGILTVIPSITRANISIDHIDKLYQDAEKIIELQESFESFEFESLTLEDVVFTYDTDLDDVPFSIGPLSMDIKKGDFTFIVGGNGSGKTTLFKIITGLYKPVSGTIKLNGELVENYTKFRSIFSPIYSDFHLFERIYGMEEVSKEVVDEYIKMMKLENKVWFKDQAFSSNALSTGQRKRLALIVSLIEDKPVLVLDEWAADQDPLFRKHFYEKMLHDLKLKGKTIVAITHDDNYFHVADKLFKMEYGKLNSIN